MDCFYAAIEVRENPALRGLPVAVGGGSRRGVVTTCSYEARAYGVRSAMPGFKARELCPQLIFLPIRFDLYRAESQRIRRIMDDYTDKVEPLSLDEAYLDVSGAPRYAWEIAREMRARIETETGLTGSAGIAPNKMLAKIASDWRKPNGQFAVRPEEVEAFMKTLPIRKVWGVGPKSAERMATEGIHTCGDLQQISRIDLVRRFGRWGEELYERCRGRDDREVEPHRIRKSLSNERTYLENLVSLAACRRAMIDLVRELEEELRQKAADRAIRKAFVKMRFSDFRRITRECVCSHPTEEVFLQLLEAAHREARLPVRLLGAGVRFAETIPESPQGWLDLDLPTARPDRD